MGIERVLKVVIGGENKGAKDAMSDTEEGAESLADRMTGALGKGALAIGAAATAGVVGIGVALTGAWQAAEESAKIARETERVIKTTGGAANITADQVGELAGTISDLTGADDELIQSSANLMLTFTSVKNVAGEGNDVFNQSIGLALDMATALGTDAAGASIQLGKALNDPIKGITALSKSGVSFTEQQKEQIKAMVEAGDTLGAQKIILAELAKEFGGAAEAAGTPLDKLKVKIGNFQEAIGTMLIPIVEQVTTWLGEKLPPVLDALTPMFAEVVGGVQAFAATWMDASNGLTSSGFAGFMERAAIVLRPIFDSIVAFVAGPALSGLRTAWDDAFGAVQATLGWLDSHQEILSALKVEIAVGMVYAVYALTAAMIPLVIEAYAFAAAMIAATWPLLLVGAAITGLIAGVIWAYNHWGFFRTAVDAVGQALLWVWNTVLVPAGAWISGTLVPTIVNLAGKVAEFASNLGGWFGNIPEALGAVVEWFESLPGIVIGFLSNLWTTISTWVVSTAVALPGLIAGWYTAFMSWVTDAIINLPGQLAFLAGFIIGWIAGQVVNLVVALAGWGLAFSNWAAGLIVAFPGWLASIAVGLWNWLFNVATTLPGQLFAWYMQFANWVVSVASNIGGWLVSVASSIWGWVSSTAAALPGQLWSWLTAFSGWVANLAGQMPGWLGRVASVLYDFIASIPGRISGALGGLLSIGQSIMEGIWAGISGAAGWLWGKIKEFAGGLVSGFLSAIKGGSPAMVMVPIGDSVVQGIELGLTRRAPVLQRAIDSMMKQVTAKTYGVADASAELLRTIQAGGQVYEDLSFAGMSDDYTKWLSVGSGMENRRQLVSSFGTPGVEFYAGHGRWDQAALGGHLADIARGRSAPAAPTVQVVVNGYVGQQEELGRVIVRQLVAAERQGQSMPWAS